MGAAEGHKESCCCNHGGRCSCAFKNDLDTVPETSGGAEDGAEEEAHVATTGSDCDATGPAAAGPAATELPATVQITDSATAGNSSVTKTPVRRRRANTTRSEGTLSLDEHGRHKPVSQKHIKIAAKTNPYPVGRGRSSRIASRANHVDDELDNRQRNGIPDTASNASDVGCCSSKPAADAAGETDDGISYSAQLGQQQRPQPETASSMMYASSFPQVSQPGSIANDQPLPLTSSMTGSYNPGDNNLTVYNAFIPEQMDRSVFGMGMSAPSVDWSQFGLDFDRGFNLGNDDKLASSRDFSFAKSFGYEFNGSELAPTMTTGTSGDVSEAEDAFVSGLDDYDFDYDYDYDGSNDAASNSITFSRTNSGFNLPASNPTVNVRSHTVSGDMNELRYLKAGKEFLTMPLTGMSDDLVTLQRMAEMQPQGTDPGDEECVLWMNEDSSMPSMVESPESDAMSFWDRPQWEHRQS
ncbi:MAG: transcriptional activator haa1 [Sporothrix epigloea]